MSPLYGNCLPTSHRSSSKDSGQVATHGHRDSQGVRIPSPTQLKQQEFRFIHNHCNVGDPVYPSIKLLPIKKNVFSSSPLHFQTFQYLKVDIWLFLQAAMGAHFIMYPGLLVDQTRRYVLSGSLRIRQHPTGQGPCDSILTGRSWKPTEQRRFWPLLT